MGRANGPDHPVKARITAIDEQARSFLRRRGSAGEGATATELGAEKTGSLDHLARYVAELQPGNRNDGFFWAACRAAESGDRDALAAIAQSARVIGLSEPEISASLRSAERTATSQHEPAAEPRPFAQEPSRQVEAG